jgi:sigma-B regulation protein RsbU (phosphoserine phosphatase)
LRWALQLAGGVAIVVGLLFYSFGTMRDRLEQSIARIKEQEYAERELTLARSIQSRLLPPQEISGNGYRIAARNVPARFVAGDFYDVFRLADGALGIAVADVSGKGMGSSLIMASVKAVLPLIAEGRGVAATVIELNRRLASELAPREFVALAYARFDPRTGALELANAGLPDPYRIAAAAPVETISATGPRLPLGVRADVTYESTSLVLAAGDRVLLLTDGLPEAVTPAGEPLGYERLSRILSPRPEETPDAYLERLFAEVRTAASAALEDDWTVLLLERTSFVAQGGERVDASGAASRYIRSEQDGDR